MKTRSTIFLAFAAILCSVAVSEINPTLGNPATDSPVASSALARGDEAFDKKHYKEAMYWYLKAVRQGDAEAENRIGYMYDNGQGVKQNYTMALHWYRRAADHGLIKARYNIGLYYESGLGVPRDLDQARAWMEKAAAGGDEDAQTWLRNHPKSKIDITASVIAWERTQQEGSQPRPRLPTFGDMASAFIVEREENKFFALTEILGPDGNVTGKGVLFKNRTQDPISGEEVDDIVLSGIVWTRRATALDKINLNLSGPNKLSDNRDFDFSMFIESSTVIPFSNGYAVNLCGAKILDGGFIDTSTQTTCNYRAKDGTPLYGHLIRRLPNGILMEDVLKPAIFR